MRKELTVQEARILMSKGYFFEEAKRFLNTDKNGNFRESSQRYEYSIPVVESGDIIEILPETIKRSGNNYELVIRKKGGKYNVSYEGARNFSLKKIEGMCYISTLYYMLIYVINEGLV